MASVTTLDNDTPDADGVGGIRLFWSDLYIDREMGYPTLMLAYLTQ